MTSVFSICIGLIGAGLQSFSYLSSRYFSTKHIHLPQHGIRLLLHGHALMGIPAFLTLIAVWPSEWPQAVPQFNDYFAPLVLNSGCYFIGQGLFILALRHADASRLSPLLGIKIIILAIINLCAGTIFSPLQWCAISLCFLASLLMGGRGVHRLNKTTVLLILGACIFYCFSDINIVKLAHHFIQIGFIRGCLLSGAISYLFLSLVCFMILAWMPKVSWTVWKHSIPFTCSWYGAVCLIVICFMTLGVVFGNIIQSTRGLISIGLGILIARAGHEHLESKMPPQVALQRIFAALLMTAAIALFYIH